MRVKIITDSACDLPKEIIKKYDIEVMPLMVILNEKEYEDGVDIEAENLYKRMREGAAPKTAQASPGKIKEVFTKYAKENRECVYVGFSSELSGTFNTSVIMKEEVLEEYPDFKIEVFDSKAASMGFGLIVHKAGQLAEEGKSIEEILEAVDFYSKHMEHIFTVDSLEYLYRGGRVSKTKAFVGGLLNIKPILDVEDGKLIPIEKVRGRNKVVKRMIEIMKERGKDLENQVVGISHGDDIEVAMQAKELMETNFGVKNFIVSMIGSSVGSHSGPGTLAIFFLNKTE
ncbi:DegV family protein [Clostridium sp. D2Q-11]|uniref:DegV family protein n=1 Tax=Anaeromonas frigoriresistens TaxID=2683708 RepID=A0A942UV00_9FIRM|nr:DegV family protein [Anaeromonas frigoriresistens]MBS4539083.1 DegV family protein [Anaeromonas frigoriresistens]